MCEVCNNRYNNCPACCDDGEPDNMEQPESEKNRPMPVASQETIDAMHKLYIKRPMTYDEAYDLLNKFIDSHHSETVIAAFKIILAEYMVGMLEPERILRTFKSLI